MTWLRALFEHTARFHGPTLLLCGVFWDYLTLRIDRLLDNLLLAVYLLIFGAAIVLQLRDYLGTGVPAFVARRMHWVRYLGQFLLGGLLSAYFIYYLHGAPLLRAILWLFVLALMALAAEFLSSWTRLPELWVPVFGAVAFHFGLAGVPVLLGWFIGPTFPLLLAVFLSACIHLLAAIPWTRPDPRRLNRLLFGSSLGVGGVVLLELFAWRADLIPPLPLTLMGAEIRPERHESYRSGIFWDSLAGLGFPPQLVWTPGLSVEARTPVFLPARMETSVFHVWEHWNQDAWVRTDAIELQIHGGRPEGFRTYSRKRHLAPGPWRVRFTSVDGRELGRVRFELNPEPAHAP